MIIQRNFVCAAASAALLSDRFLPAPIRSLFAISFRERPALRRIDDDRRHDQATTAGIPDMKVSVRQVFGIDSDLEVRPISRSIRTYRMSIWITGSIAPPRSPSSRVSRTTAASWSPAITAPAIRPYRAGRGPVELACLRVNLDSHISPIDLVAGFHRHQGRQAGHGIPRRHPCPSAPAARSSAGVRRIRRRPARRDVRDPARAEVSGR